MIRQIRICRIVCPKSMKWEHLILPGLLGLNAAFAMESENLQFRIFFEREQKNRKKLLEILSQYDFYYYCRQCSSTAVCWNCVLSFSMESAVILLAVCLSEHGVSVRTGLQCAPLAHKFLGTYPAGTIRFSVGYFYKRRGLQWPNQRTGLYRSKHLRRSCHVFFRLCYQK